MNVCIYVQNKRGIPIPHSGLKCCIRSTPPISFRSPKNMWGSNIFHGGQVPIFPKKFLALPPPKYSKVKRRGYSNVLNYIPFQNTILPHTTTILLLHIITLQLQLQPYNYNLQLQLYNYNCNYNYTITTIQLQLQLQLYNYNCN